MQALAGWVAKGGAEGLLCAASPDGLGIALKVEDGNSARAPAGARPFLRPLGLDGSIFGPAPVRNSRDEVVGEVRRRPARKILHKAVDTRVKIRAAARVSRGNGEPALYVPGSTVPLARKQRSIAHRRHLPPGRRRAPQARTGRNGEGLPHLRRDRRRARGGRAHQGADRGLLHVPDRPLDRAGRRASSTSTRRTSSPRWPRRRRARSSTSPSSRRSTRSGSTCARSARCRC